MSKQFIDVAHRVLKNMLGTRRDWRIVRPSVPSLPRIGTHSIGPLIVAVSIGVGWFVFKDTRGDGAVGFALFIGSASIMLMAWSNFLATRAVVFEKIFGGLDRVYMWHRWYGALSVGAMWLHMQTADDVKGIRGASKDVADAAEDLASTGSNLLYVLVAVSLLRWLPTRWWRLSHKLLVLPYGFACWHFYTATKPYANYSLWGAWFGVFMLLGLSAWVYRVVWRDVVRRGRQYRVTNINYVGNALEIEMEPIGTALRHQVGQFVFLKFSTNGMSEPHPFTIASSPDESVLRFIIKDLGDWTGKLGNCLQVDDRVTVEGPYGALPVFPKHHVDNVIWIAGGVGVTPFLGAARTQKLNTGPTPHLFYCIRDSHEAAGLAELEQADQQGRIKLHVFASNEGRRLDVHDIVNVVGTTDFVNTHVVMCGPDSLVKTIRSSVRAMGARHIHAEAFDIRSGVGPDLSRAIDEMIASRLSSRNNQRAHDSTGV